MPDTLWDLFNSFSVLPLLMFLVFFKGLQARKQYPAPWEIIDHSAS